MNTLNSNDFLKIESKYVALRFINGQLVGFNVKVLKLMCKRLKRTTGTNVISFKECFINEYISIKKPFI